MTTDKARKRAVRTRMDKTGERYAAARRHVVTDDVQAPVRPSQPALPPRVADPGMSDAGIRKGTGRGWDDWFRDLDAWDATARMHTEIARYLHETFEINGWWAQGVTVGYERARGMRARHETTRGFEVTVSKTIAATPDALWPFLDDAAQRERWVGADILRPRPRPGVAGKHARFDVVHGGSRVVVYLTPKGDSRTTVTVSHERLAGPADVATRRAFWRDRLAALAAVTA